MQTKETNSSTRVVVFTGVLSALAIVLYYFEFPLFTQYLKIDLGDLPAAVAGILFGPLAGVAVELIKNIAHLPVSATMGFGELMNFIVGAALVAPLSAVMRALRRRRGSAASTLAAGAAGLVAMVLAGVVGNYLIAPPYFAVVLHVTLKGAVLWSAIGSATLLNLVKSVVVTLLLFPVMTAGGRLFVRYGR